MRLPTWCLGWALAGNVVLAAAAAGSASATAGAKAGPIPPEPAGMKAGQVPPQLPVEHFFRHPTYSDLSFSPDGKSLALLESIKGRQNLVVLDLASNRKAQLTNLRDQDVAAYTWVSNSRLAFVLDTEGNEFFGLYVVDRDGRNFRELSGTLGSQQGKGKWNPRQLQLFSRIEGDDDRILVLANERYPTVPDVFRLDLRTGCRTMAVANPGNVIGWLPDRRGVVRIGVVAEPGRTRLLYRDHDEAEWQVLREADALGLDWQPLGFDGDHRTLFMAVSAGRRPAAVHRFDTATRELDPAPVAADPVHDVDGIRYWRSVGKVMSVTYHAERPKTQWLDASGARHQAIVDQALPHTRNVINEATPDGQILLVFSYSDREPGVYYLMDLGQKQIQEIAVTRDWISPEQMAEMKPVRFSARDGLPLHGYLTLPVGREPRGLPLIVLPHGGPFGIRDTWGFQPEVQFLANRGYAVLQVNFRGSGGYGAAFEQAGYRKWGREMQHDLSDAVAWAVAEGVADPGKVAIMGASYGGYAVMAGLAFTPELYCAGVNLVGVTDLEVLFNGSVGWPAARREAYALRIADPKQDEAMMRAISPVHHAAAIRAPVFLAYGENDPRVDLQHGYRMERALKKEGKRYEYFLRKDEGHGYRKEENAVELYRRIEAFLKQHVPAG